jgi:hypothetical protein
MIHDQYARHNGEPKMLRAGQQYEVDDELLRQLIILGVVEMVEQKAISAAPENKAIMQAPTRKGASRARTKKV